MRHALWRDTTPGPPPGLGFRSRLRDSPPALPTLPAIDPVFAVPGLLPLRDCRARSLLAVLRSGDSSVAVSDFRVGATSCATPRPVPRDCRARSLLVFLRSGGFSIAVSDSTPRPPFPAAHSIKRVRLFTGSHSVFQTECDLVILTRSPLQRITMCMFMGKATSEYYYYCTWTIPR